MPRIQLDPGLLECPDFASAVYAAARAPFINLTTTEDQAVQFLKNIWDAGNQADKVRWQQQIEDDNAALTECHRLQSEADTARLQAEIVEAETLRKEEMKKKQNEIFANSRQGCTDDSSSYRFQLRHQKDGERALHDAVQTSNTTDDEAMVMLRQPDGITSWVPAASARDGNGVIDDKDISWEDFCQAAPQMIVAMEEADWPQDRVVMLAKFWGNLQIHELHSSRDPLDQKTLIVYQAEQCRLWHIAISSPRGAYNLSRINEELIWKTCEWVYWDDRKLKDNKRDYRVCPFTYCFIISILTIAFSPLVPIL
ncbi:hypothetical protein BYT27DRAFT_7260679, partial [Phlegmacium glaucopus]